MSVHSCVDDLNYPHHHHLYVYLLCSQIRSVSIYGVFSNWSDAKCINTSTLGDLHMLIASTVITTDMTTERQDSSESKMRS